MDHQSFRPFFEYGLKRENFNFFQKHFSVCPKYIYIPIFMKIALKLTVLLAKIDKKTSVANLYGGGFTTFNHPLKHYKTTFLLIIIKVFRHQYYTI